MPRWETVQGKAPLSQIRVPEEFWGERAGEMIPWLRRNYDPDTMPPLQVATVKGRPEDEYTLLGWDFEGSGYPPLLQMVYGDEYAEAVLLRNKLRGKIVGDHSVDGEHRGRR